MNTELANAEQLFLKETQTYGPSEPLVTLFSSTDQYIYFVLCVFLFKDNLLICIVDSMCILNSKIIKISCYLAQVCKCSQKH